MRVMMICAALVAGCATPPPPLYSKANSAPGDLDRDLASCQYDVEKSINQTPTQLKGELAIGQERAAMRRQMMPMCMRSKGWTVQ